MSLRASASWSIVSHGQGPLIASLLDDLYRHELIDPDRDEVILTLNAPEDESFVEAARGLPLTVLRNAQRRGFGANHNAAFAVSQADVFLVVNPDIRLPRFDPTPMFDALGRADVGLWAPRVLSPEGNTEDSARRFPTVARLGRRVLLRQRAADYGVSERPVVVDWVAGMFMALRRQTYAEVGGFDERYFMYMEDADLCRRVGRSGRRVLYDPQTSVVHDARRASRRSVQHLRWHLRSAIRFITSL